ncbi:MAG: hypothetical protein GY915_02000 [bacterium]|nr:hypothetical protein [bacterium]
MEEVMAKLLADIAMFAAHADGGDVRDSVILDRVKTLESLAKMFPDRYRDFRWKIENDHTPEKKD